MLRRKLSYPILALVIFCTPFAVKAQSVWTPPARLTFTFDISTHVLDQQIAPMFSAHAIPAVMYAETLLLNSGEIWAMNWQDVINLKNNYGWEIGSHSKTHPNLTTVSDAQLEDEVGGSKTEFTTHGIEVNSFATPLGAYDTRVLKNIAKHYTSHRTAWGGPNKWPDEFNSYQLKVFEPTSTTTPEQISQMIDAAYANNEWLIFLFHGVVNTNPGEHEYPIAALQQILDYAATHPISKVTVEQGLQFAEDPNLITNPSFETVSGGFATSWLRSDLTVVLDTLGKGLNPFPTNSVKLTASTTKHSIQSTLIPVLGSEQYQLSMFQDATTFTSGSYSVWIDEFNSSTQWISGKWLGNNLEPYFGTRLYSYKPTSTNVSSIATSIYTDLDSVLILYVDEVKLQKLGTITPPPPPPPAQVTSLFGGPFTLIGGSLQQMEISNLTAVTNTPHELTVYATTTNYVGGAWAIWVDEFSADNTWLSGKWFGQNTGNGSSIKKFTYTPTSAQVAKTAFAIYTETNSSLTLRINGATLSTGAIPPPPPSGNLVNNSSFETVGSDGFAQNWTRVGTGITLDNTSQGTAPTPLHSVKITGGVEERGVMTENINVIGTNSYTLSYYLKLQTFGNGTAIWIDEYNSSGVWLSGQWKNGIYTNSEGLRTTTYIPTSGSVSKITIRFFAEPSSNLTAYLDAVSLIKN